ncbi:hypothetical protein STEG23_028669, partial [Scotinomys teguina]
GCTTLLMSSVWKDIMVSKDEPQFTTFADVTCGNAIVYIKFVALEAACVTQYTLLSNQLHLQNIHYKESLLWFKASGLRHTIITGPSPKLLPDILLLIRVMEILQLLFNRTSPFMHSSSWKPKEASRTFSDPLSEGRTPTTLFAMPWQDSPPSAHPGPEEASTAFQQDL